MTTNQEKQVEARRKRFQEQQQVTEPEVNVTASITVEVETAEEECATEEVSEPVTKQEKPMLNIRSILEFVYTGVRNHDPRFDVLNQEHVMDTLTGVEYHMYDTYSKATHGDKELLSSYDLTKEEQAILWEIKKLITDPEVMRAKLQQPEYYMRARRKALADAYSEPSPVKMAETVTEEVGTVAYKG